MTLKVHLFSQIQKMEEKLQRRLSSKDIATGAGIHETTLSHYRNGKVSMVKLETLEKLADYFGCEPGDLLRRV